MLFFVDHKGDKPYNAVHQYHMVYLVHEKMRALKAIILLATNISVNVLIYMPFSKVFHAKTNFRSHREICSTNTQARKFMYKISSTIYET